MKKLYFLPALLAAGAFTLASCSSSDDLDGGTAQTEGSQFMSVEIINATQGLQGGAAKKSPFTRADNNQNGNGKYSDGTEDENALTNARFLFFNANGSLVNMNNGLPYAQIENLSNSLIDNSKDNSQTIERKYGVVVLDPVRGSVPNQVMVIANYTSIPDAETSFNASDVNINNILSNGNSSWTVSKLYNDKDNGKKEFIMTSTVFANAQNDINCPAPTAGKIVPDRNAAINNPVQVYVERVAAKVDAQRSNASNWIKVTESTNGNYSKADANATNALDAYQLYTKSEANAPEFVTPDGSTAKYDVIAVVKGIGLADEMNKAYLYKNIAGGRDAGWDPNGDGTGTLGFAFSIPAFHRSFWETVPDQNPSNMTNHSWTAYTDGKTFPKTLNASNTADDAQAMYTFPNTPTQTMWTAANTGTTPDRYWNYNTSYTRLTKLLLATQLYVDKNGDGNYEPTTIYQFGGQNYLDETSVKNAIASTLPIVIRTKQADGSTEWSDISADNIVINKPQNGFNDQNQYMETLSLKINDNQVVAKGSIANGTVTFASDGWAYGDDNNGVAAAENFINGNASYKPIIYKDGMSYYYTTIRHLATDPTKLGAYGVVRNHEYRITVNGLGGFGTAVYDPDNTIIPVTPTNSNTYMAANINVLQWRVVEQNVDINTQDPTGGSTTPTTPSTNE